jgi:hypothetical protein
MQHRHAIAGGVSPPETLKGCHAAAGSASKLKRFQDVSSDLRGYGARGLHPGLSPMP